MGGSLRSLVRAFGPVAIFLAVGVTRAAAQHSGAYGGRAPDASQRVGHARLSPEEAGSFVRVEGSCELRVPADGLRVVFAVTSEAETAGDCWKTQKTRRDAFVGALTKSGVAADAVEVDFVAILPVYDWMREVRDGQSLLVEKLVAQRVQENVHVAVANEEAARRVIEVALDHGVTDVIAVDYWSRQSQAKRREALEAALAEAQSKSKLLLASFATPPLLANVQEETQLLTPTDLYRSFENAYAGDVRTQWSDATPRVSAPRPKNTFYEGFHGEVDRGGASGPAMKPEISVVATVVLYYESPAHEHGAPSSPPR